MNISPIRFRPVLFSLWRGVAGPTNPYFPSTFSKVRLKSKHPVFRTHSKVGASAGPRLGDNEVTLTLSATDVLAPTTMKNAAKCDTSCELQKLVSHQNFERNLHFPLGSMSVGVSVHPHSSPPLVSRFDESWVPEAGAAPAA